MDAMLVVKASLLLSLTLLAARLLRRGPAVARHRLWSLGFAALLALPLLALALPALYVPVPAAWSATAFVSPGPPAGPPAQRPAPHRPAPERPAPQRSAPQRSAASSQASAVRSGDPLLAESGGSETRPYGDSDAAKTRAHGDSDGAKTRVYGDDEAKTRPYGSRSRALLLAVWLTGTIAAGSVLLVSLLRVRRLARTGEDLGDPAWRRAADAIGARLGLRCQARLLVSPLVGTPMAGGTWRPVIFLPVSARTWSAECRNVVLAHEIAHLAGRDPLRHLAARLAVALYWFHPLAWIAAREAAVAREQACDETVLALGTRPSAYARVLLDLAESMHPSAPPCGALPMVERSLLERRVMAILNDDVRPTTRRTMLIPAMGVALLTLCIAAAQPLVSASPSSVAPGVTAGPVSVGPASEMTPVARFQSITPRIVEPSPSLAVKLSPPPADQADVARDSACWSWNATDSSSFNGNLSTSSTGSRTVIHEQIGSRGTDRVIKKTLGDLRLCMLAEDAGGRGSPERPSQWLGRSRRVVLEAQRGGVVQRLEFSQVGGTQRPVWQVDGAERPFDAATQRWKDRMLAVLDTTWELSTLRGNVSSLRGQISSIHGQRSSLQGRISSLQGEVSSMRGQISSIHGQESSLRGRISSIQGHLSSLRGAISSEQGAISSLNASRYRADEAERERIASTIKQHNAEIARIDQAIRDYDAAAKVATVEQQIAMFDAIRKAAAIDAEIRAFDLQGKVAEIQRSIADLDVAGKVAAIEQQIEALDADRRGRQLEERRNEELKQLEAAIAAIR